MKIFKFELKNLNCHKQFPFSKSLKYMLISKVNFKDVSNITQLLL